MPRRPGSPSPAQFSPIAPPRTFLARDHLPEEISTALRSKAWEQVRAGAYMETPAEADPYRRRRLTALAHAAAVSAKTTGSMVLIRETAALLHGLPMVGRADLVHLAQAFRPGPRDSVDVHRRFLTIPPDQTVQLYGLPVTTLERTVVDCAMALGRRDGLVIADAALHVGADRDACRRILEGLPGRRGVVAARWVLEHADDGSESPGESYLRFVTLLAGLPRPETQVRVATALGEFWSDVGWPEQRVLLEYDGATKYEASGSASAAVLAEKRRQETLEAAGWIVIRVTAADLRDPTALLSRIDRALRSRHPRLATS